MGSISTWHRLRPWGRCFSCSSHAIRTKINTYFKLIRMSLICKCNMRFICNAYFGGFVLLVSMEPHAPSGAKLDTLRHPPVRPPDLVRSAPARDIGCIWGLFVLVTCPGRTFINYKRLLSCLSIPCPQKERAKFRSSQNGMA